MDQYGKLPLTIAALYERLRHGQVLTIDSGTDGFSYALYLNASEHIILRQGDQEQLFRQLEPAVLTLLNCLGEFHEK